MAVQQVGKPVEGPTRRQMTDTRRDVNIVGAKVDAVGVQLGTQIGQVGTNLGTQIGQVRTDLGTRLDQVETNLGNQIGQTEQNLSNEVRLSRGQEARNAAGILAGLQSLEQTVDAQNQLKKDEVERRKRSEMLDDEAIITICNKDPRFAQKHAELVARLRNDPNADPQAALTELIDFIKKEDPKAREALVLLDVRNQVRVNRSFDFDQAIRDNPTMASLIRETAVNELVQDYAFSMPMSMFQIEQELDLMPGMDEKTKREVLLNVQNKARMESQRMIDRFESGQIGTLDELKKEAEMFPQGSIVRAQVEEYVNRVNRDKTEAQKGTVDMEALLKVKDEKTRAILLQGMINNSLGNMPQPGRTLYERMLREGLRQQVLDKKEVDAKKITLSTEAEEKKFNADLERIKVIAKHIGPGMLISIAGLSIGIASGDLNWALLGGVVGGGTMMGSAVFKGGLTEWKHIKTLAAQADEAIAHANAEGGRLDMGLTKQQEAYLNLFADIKARSIATQRGGNLTPQQFQSLKNDVMRYVGLFPQQQSLMNAYEGVMTSQFA